MLSRVFWIAALLVLPLAALRADEVQLGKSDRLSGTILEMSHGKLRFGSQSLGEMQIPWAAITDVRSDGNLAIYGEGGKVFVGVLAGIDGVMLKVQTAQGAQALDTRAVNQISTDLPRGENPKPVTTWRGSARLGFGYATGNTNRNEYSVGGDLRRKGARSETQVSASAEQGETNDQRDTARISGKLGYTVAQAGRTFYALNADIEHDDIRQLQLRGNYSLSFGYNLVDTSPNRWSMSLGTNYVNERYKTRNSDDIALRLESQTDWVVFKRSRISLNVVTYPAVKDFGHIRSSSDLSFSVPISGAVELTLGVNDEFDSQPPDGVHKNDLRTRTSLGYNF